MISTPFCTRALSFLALTGVGCTSLIAVDDKQSGGQGDGTGDTGPGDASDLCAASTPLTTSLTITFDEAYDGCAWGKNGNNPAEDAHVSGRVEQVETLDLGADTVLCDATFDFQPGDAVGQGMEYDDNFFFTFDDVVLAASYAPLVDEFALDGTLPIYSWEAIVGLEFGFDTDTPTWCLGEEEGLAECEIPPPETQGRMSLDFDEVLIEEMAQRALALGRLDYAFITIGDNDDSDCSHAEFSFDVEVAYVER